MSGPETLIVIYKKAVFQKDIEAYASLFDEEVIVYDMWQRWSYTGLAEWKEMAKGWFSSLGTNRDLVTFDEVNIQSLDDMAIITAIARFTAVTDNGEELRWLENRLTWVAKKKADAWKIIHQHTSGPVDFQSMKVMLKR